VGFRVKHAGDLLGQINMGQLESIVKIILEDILGLLPLVIQHTHTHTHTHAHIHLIKDTTEGNKEKMK
jgi:hypothetical protein